MVAPSPAQTDVAATFGWDTVFGVNIADVNAAIASRRTFPTKFDVKDPNDGVSASGSFDAWAIALGGDNDLINMRLPISKVTISLPGGATEDQTDVSASITVRLNYLHSDKSAKSGTLHELVVWDGAPAGAEVVTVNTITYGGSKPPGFMAKAALQELLEAWLNANLASFNHVFATINLNRTADTETFQWIQPTDTAYAYCDLKGANEGILAVLCMTGNRPSTGLIQQVSSNIIPAGQRAGFLIAGDRMIEEILLPAMPQVFKGSKPTDFVLSKSGKSIINAHTGISFEAKDKDSGDTYQAYVETLEVTVVDQEIQMNVVTRTEVSAGVHAMCHTQNALGLDLVKKKTGKAGEQTLNFKKIRETVNHWLDKDPAIAITEIILAVVATVLLIIAAILTDGAALLVVAAIVAVASGAMMITMGIIGLVDTDDAPSINAFLFNATAPIKWGDARDFLLTSAGLNGSLQFGGDPGFVYS